MIVAGLALLFGTPLAGRDERQDPKLNGVAMKSLKCSMQWLVPVVLMSSSVHADGLPDQKIGLWQQTTQTTDEGKAQAPEKSEHCVDAATLAMVKKALADAAKRCSKYDLRQTSGKWILDSVCNLGGTTLTLHQETLMKGDIAYHSESDSSYVPSSSGGGHSHTVTDGVWVGPCMK
jgi:hypothetical protein